MKYLKPLRIAVSLILSFTIAFLFIDYYRYLPEFLRKISLYLQFIPSVAAFSVKASGAAAGFIVVIAATVICGRLYCSFICPLGFCQDIFIRSGRSSGLLKKRGYSRPHYVLFYTLLAASALSCILSGTFFIRWLDPFSIFGRFMAFGISLPLIELNNGIASVLVKNNNFSVSVLNIKPSVSGAIFAFSVFMLIMLPAIFHGRIYCNTICPAGALLSLISRLSFFNLAIDPSSCIKCGKCSSVCKSSCIDYAAGHIDTARCVSCFNCVSVCPEQSVRFARRKIQAVVSKRERVINSDNTSATITRSGFIAGLILLPNMVFSQGKQAGAIYRQDPAKQKKYSRKSYSSPPGSISTDNFNSRCTACSLCITACPTKVLQPAVLQYGLNGIMQPFMDFSSGFCNYDCTKCGEVCPAGAILETGIDAKRRIQTGKSVFVIENCITYTNGTDCGACSEHCPTKAVQMVPFRNNLVIPEVNNAICTGCGACEYACPVRPLRAIYVEGNPVHKTAELPEVREVIKTTEPDFPF